MEMWCLSVADKVLDGITIYLHAGKLWALGVERAFPACTRAGTEGYRQGPPNFLLPSSTG